MNGIFVSEHLVSGYLLLSDDECNHGLVKVPAGAANITSLLEAVIANAMSAEHAVIALDENHELLANKVMFVAKLKYSKDTEAEKHTFWLEPIDLIN